MALNLLVKYPVQVGPGTADYPHGAPRNVSLPGAGDGTPWEQAIVRDIYGFFEKIMADAAIVPSGNADTAQVSQYLEGLQALLLNRSELATNGGDILVVGNRLTSTHKDGLFHEWFSGVKQWTFQGSARNRLNTTDLEMGFDILKTVNATWAVGAPADGGSGGLAAALMPLAAGAYRKFLLSRPDGTSDIGWDTSAVAANLFSDANVIAAGFSDPDLYRRIGWDVVDGGLTIPKYYADENGARIFDVSQIDVSTTVVGSASRTGFILASVAPNMQAVLNFTIEHNQVSEYLITEGRQSDTVAGPSNFTVRTTGGDNGISFRGNWRVDSSNRIFVRRSAAGSVQTFDVVVDGWFDDGLTL